MNTLAEIEAAVDSLTGRQQKALLGFLAKRVASGAGMSARRKRGLKAASHPPLDGLPATLSVQTRERVKRMLARRHATDR